MEPKKWNNKIVKEIMIWNIIDTAPNKSYNSQIIVSVTDETVLKYSSNFNPHKRHKSKSGNWYYVDTNVDIPIGQVRILQTNNSKTGHTDYVYDPLWFPNIISNDSDDINEVDDIDILIDHLIIFKNTGDIKLLQNVKKIVDTWDLK
jgi:hypothetical protein